MDKKKYLRLLLKLYIRNVLCLPRTLNSFLFPNSGKITIKLKHNIIVITNILYITNYSNLGLFNKEL